VIWNFFEDSRADAEWRVVLSALIDRSPVPAMEKGIRIARRLAG
jgi:hypothetical protein